MGCIHVWFGITLRYSPTSSSRPWQALAWFWLRVWGIWVQGHEGVRVEQMPRIVSGTAVLSEVRHHLSHDGRDLVCEECGAVGYRHLLATRVRVTLKHSNTWLTCGYSFNPCNVLRYCLNPVVYDGSSIEWFCEDCASKHNELEESLKWRCDDYHPIDLASSIIDEPNVNRVEVTNELWSWGHRRHRSHKASRYSTWGCRRHRSRNTGRDSTDGCTEHFPTGSTFNSSEMFIEEKSKCNNADTEGDYQPRSADISNDSASDLAAEIQKTMGDVEPSMNNYSEMFIVEKSKCNDADTEGVYQPKSDDISNDSASDIAAEIQKTMEDATLSMNTTECPELSKEKGSCSLSLNNVEGSIPQGSKANFLPLISDVEKSHKPVAGDSCPTPPIVEQECGSSQTLESAGQSHALEVVHPDGSSHSPLDPALEIEEKGIKTCIFASVNDLEQSHPSFPDKTSPTSSVDRVDGSSPTSESWEQPQPLEVVRPWNDAPKSIVRSKPSSNYSHPMQASDLYVGIMDILNLSKDCLDSRPMSNTVEPSSSSNGEGYSAVEKGHAERTKCLSGMETATPALGSSPLAEPSSSSSGGGQHIEKNSAERIECLSGMETVTPALVNGQGSSTSTAKECLVDNSDEANRSDNHFLCTTESKEGGQLQVPSHLNILNGGVHCSRNDLDESSNPKSGPKGRSTQNDCPKDLVSVDKNVVCSHESQMEDVNSEAFPSKNVSPCKSKATKSRTGKQLNRHTQHHTEKKTKLILKDSNFDPAQLKSCWSSKQSDQTFVSASSELSSKTKEVNDVNDAEPRSSSSARTFENAGPMKRKRLNLPHNVDAKAMQVEDSNPRCSADDGQVRMNTGHVESSVMNQRRSAENHKEVLCPGNSNQHVNNRTRTKKQRRDDKDKKGPLGNPIVQCTANDAEQLASEAPVAGGNCNLSRMPVFSAPADQQRFICPQPIDKPYWTFYADSGIVKIGQEYISMAAHLPNEAHRKVQELSRSLPPVMKVTMHSKSKAWPKRFEASEPTAESIGLYFFSDSTRPNKELDRLVQYVTEHSIVLKYAFGFAKLLIFPSVLLPEQCQMFQGKHYLWGVFRRRSGTSKAATQAKQKVSTAPKSYAAEKKDHQDKVQSDAQNQEMPVSNGTTPSDSQLTPGTAPDVGIETEVGDHRKPQASSEAPPTKLLGIVVAQTPRAEQFIKELENEGALVFSVTGLAKPGPVKL
ncbi:hypothetical protein HU200_067633 [Digitaria exilis]|uniref:AIPP2-like SPOC-like domain-containing protein n=1 Tax=Digitaria exilis TaxID=1010633 RepID=A0A834ZYF9_9POAL|nr:hypothetical protein HU200_067633 [Digitaria exilis]